MNNNLYVIVINGIGGAGKDTLINHYKDNAPDIDIHSISSINVIKDVARQLGWNDDKDEKGRDFLASLKRCWVDYCDGAYHTIVKELQSAYVNAKRKTLYFIHIRESSEIIKIRDFCLKGHIQFATLLITNDKISDMPRLKSTDNRYIIENNYSYDYRFDNTFKSEEEGNKNKERFIDFINKIEFNLKTNINSDDKIVNEDKNKIIKIVEKLDGDIAGILSLDPKVAAKYPQGKAVEEVTNILKNLRHDTIDVDKVKDVLWNYSQIDGEHHKAWCLDQIARIVYGDKYNEFVAEYEESGDYEWDFGIAP